MRVLLVLVVPLLLLVALTAYMVGPVWGTERWD